MRNWHRSFEVLVACTLVSLGAAAHETALGDPMNHAWVGPYVKGGINIGATEIDRSQVDTGAGGGVALALGWRALPWLAGEFQFDYLGGSEIEVNGTDIGDANFFDFTFNAKTYPIPLLNEHVLSGEVPLVGWVEPYVLFGIGGGELEIDGSNGGRSTHEGTFVVRLGLGIDFLLTDHCGVYTDGGFHFTTDDELDDDDIVGVGVFTLGAFWRF